MELTEFTELLRQSRHRFTRQQCRTLKGQALAGDVNGAVKGLRRILKRGVTDGENNNGYAAC